MLRICQQILDYYVYKYRTQFQKFFKYFDNNYINDNSRFKKYWNYNEVIYNNINNHMLFYTNNIYKSMNRTLNMKFVGGYKTFYNFKNCIRMLLIYIMIENLIKRLIFRLLELWNIMLKINQ